VFFAHDIAAWLGIPTGVVIVIMLIMRKRLKELRVRRKQGDRSLHRRPPNLGDCWRDSRETDE
jgi:hypothetical protein